MAYAPHCKFSFGGSLQDQYSGPEIWNCTVSIIGPGVADAAAYQEAVAPALATWFAAPATRCSSNAKLEYLKVNHIDPDGTYTSGTDTNRHDYTPGVAGGNAQSMPSIMSTVTSWRTDIARGPGSKGRIYLPNMCSEHPTALVQSAAWCTEIATAGKALITLIEAPFGSGSLSAIAVVASGVDGSTHQILNVAVGNVIDVQRRRKNALKEVYTAVAVH